MTDIRLADIMEETRCQPRATLDPDMISTYHEDMHAGAAFPPLTVFHDGQRYWLADGYHRLAALKRRGATTACCDVREGTIRDAILHAVGTNATHGLRRSNADKRRAVELLLGDDEWTTWSENKIAQCCHVTRYLVINVRESLAKQQVIPERTYTDRWGNTSTMNIENIGRRRTATVDTDTGEVLDDADDDDYPDAEEVDPTDIDTYQWEAAPAANVTAAPARVALDISLEPVTITSGDTVFILMHTDPDQPPHKASDIVVVAASEAGISRYLDREGADGESEYRLGDEGGIEVRWAADRDWGPWETDWGFSVFEIELEP